MIKCFFITSTPILKFKSIEQRGDFQVLENFKTPSKIPFAGLNIKIINKYLSKQYISY